MMNYSEFKERVVAEFKNYLPETYQALDLNLRTVDKINREQEHISMFGKGITTSPSLCLDDMYQAYIDCGSFPQAMTEVAVIMVKAMEEAPQIALKDILASKDKIIYQLVNTEWNKGMLEKVPHREFLDLSIIYRILVGNSETDLRAAVINNQLAEQIGLSEEQLYALAKENTEKLLPLKIVMVPWVEDMYALTNNAGVNGAVCMLYENGLCTIAQEFDSNLYILPSSTHEIIAIPTAGELETLLDIVKLVNEEEVHPTERLSNSVYHYDRESREITLAEE